MKKQIILTSVVTGIALTGALFTGCQRPTERPSVVNSKIAANLFEVKDLSELTGEKSKTVFYQGSEKDISKFAGVNQAKLDGTKAQDIIKKVKSPAAKAALDEHLKTGVVALVVLDDQIKVLKLVPETFSTFENKVTSMAFVTKLKALSKTSDVKVQNDLFKQLNDLQYKSPAELGETFGLVEIAAIKVTNYGVLDNEKTDYNEKKSTLNIDKKPFEFATHIVIGDEIGAAADEASAEASAK